MAKLSRAECIRRIRRTRDCAVLRRFTPKRHGGRLYFAFGLLDDIHIGIDSEEGIVRLQAKFDGIIFSHLRKNSKGTYDAPGLVEYDMYF